MKKIYLSSVALEKNRWAKLPGRVPSFNVSDFIPKIKSDGFCGVELWQYHYTLTSDEEKSRLASSGIPFIFNSYVSIVNRDDELYNSIGDAVKNLGATAVKYNFGSDIETLSQQLENLNRLTDCMPDGVKMLCECHPNTLMEVPEVAGEVFDKLDKNRFGAIIHMETASDFADRCFANYGDRICHIHCAYKNGENSFVPMDDDTENIKNYINYYLSKGFDGSLAIEFVKFEDTAEQHYANALKDLEVLNSLYK